MPAGAQEPGGSATHTLPYHTPLNPGAPQKKGPGASTSWGLAGAPAAAPAAAPSAFLARVQAAQAHAREMDEQLNAHRAGVEGREVTRSARRHEAEDLALAALAAQAEAAEVALSQIIREPWAALRIAFR